MNPKLPFSLRKAFNLFLAIVFPIHFWAILLFILEAPNVENANLQGEFLAIGSYILLFALFESAVVFLGLFLLRFLFPSRWTEEQRFAVSIALLLALLGWSLIAQLSTLLVIPNNEFFIYIGINLANTLIYRQLTFFFLLVLVLTSVLLAMRLAYRWGDSKKLERVVERIVPLSMLYLFLDIAAFIFVLSRNA